MFKGDKVRSMDLPDLVLHIRREGEIIMLGQLLPVHSQDESSSHALRVIVL